MKILILISLFMFASCNDTIKGRSFRSNGVSNVQKLEAPEACKVVDQKIKLQVTCLNGQDHSDTLMAGTLVQSSQFLSYQRPDGTKILYRKGLGVLHASKDVSIAHTNSFGLVQDKTHYILFDRTGANLSEGLLVETKVMISNAFAALTEKDQGMLWFKDGSLLTVFHQAEGLKVQLSNMFASFQKDGGTGGIWNQKGIELITFSNESFLMIKVSNERAQYFTQDFSGSFNLDD